MYDLNKIDKFFVMEKAREGQKEAIAFILDAFNSGKRFVIVEAPTGSGKTAIGMTIANFVKNSFYITSTKHLQDQIIRDFNNDVIELKGRNAYPCTLYDRLGQEFVQRGILTKDRYELAMVEKPNCVSGFCKTKASTAVKCQPCFPRFNGGSLDVLPVGMYHNACPYYEQVGLAMAAKNVVMNFSSFLYQTTMTKRFDVPRELLIIDECFHPHTYVTTELGSIAIGKLVNAKMQVRVASYNQLTKQIEYKPITRWLRRKKQLTYKVLVGDELLYPTADHKIYTPTGKKKLSQLKIGDYVYVRQYNEVSAKPIRLIEPYKKSITYDLEVAENHNYFAGNTLVSNCHNAETQLLDFISLSLSDNKLQNHGITIPKFDKAEAYADWIMESEIYKAIYAMIKQAQDDENSKEEDDLKRLLTKCKLFVANALSETTEWVAEFNEHKTYRTVILKPIFVSSFARSLLFDRSKQALMMSATVLDVNVMCKSLGIDKSEIAAYRMQNRFPVKNRPIYYTPVAKMTGGAAKMPEWTPPLISGVEKIVRKYPNQKGIIHTHNFAIMDALFARCAKDVSKRFLSQRDFYSKQELVAHHASTTDSIIVAPAMHEGVDLIDDLSRFQIICKVPYPNCFDDKQLARRVELDHSFYIWLTALKLVQSTGRSVRSETDYADTYILDAAFENFKRNAKRILPKWFMDALRDKHL